MLDNSFNIHINININIFNKYDSFNAEVNQQTRPNV